MHKKAAHTVSSIHGFLPQHRHSPQDLHPAVKEFSRLLVAEIRDHLVEQVAQLAARPIAFCAHCFYPRRKQVKFLLIKGRGILYDAEALKSIHVERLPVREEFLKVLLAGRVAFEEVDGILPSGF